MNANESIKKVMIEVDIETLKTLSDVLTDAALNNYKDKIDWFKFSKLTRLNLDLTLKYYEVL